MKYHVPEIGDIIQLSKDWKVPLEDDRRNETMYQFLPDRYEVPEWMLKVDWSKCGSGWRRGTHPVPIPGMPPEHKVTSVLGCIKRGQPVWFRKLQVNLHKRHDVAARDGMAARVDYTLLSFLPIPGGATVTVPQGAKLTVDRVYIRQGARKFSSVSFKYPAAKARFFASVADVARMEFTLIESKPDAYAGRAFNSIGG